MLVSHPFLPAPLIWVAMGESQEKHNTKVIPFCHFLGTNLFFLCFNYLHVSFFLQDLVCARRTPHLELWSTPLTWLYPKGSPPLSTVKQRGGQPRQWSGTRMERGWKLTKMIHGLTACCFPLARFSSYVLFMDGGANRTRGPMSV